MRVLNQLQVVTGVLLPVLAAFPVLVVGDDGDGGTVVTLWHFLSPPAGAGFVKPLLLAVLVLSASLLAQGSREVWSLWWSLPLVPAGASSFVMLFAADDLHTDRAYGGDALLVTVLIAGVATAMRMLGPERDRRHQDEQVSR
jgi:hypothetical protein